MKKIIFIIAFIAGLFALPARAASGDLFVYPTPPDSMMQLQNRCDYIVSRFWQRCNFDRAMRNRAQFHKAFGDWVSIMPHASADTVHAAVDDLLARFAKKGPETLALAQMARAWTFSDTTEFCSDEIYAPFANAAAAHKKIAKQDRAIFAADAKRLNTSMVGATVPALSFTLRGGETSGFDKLTPGASVLLFFCRRDDVDASLARLNLDLDHNARELIERGELAIACINPETYTPEWDKDVASYPANWTVAAMPDAADYFDLSRPVQLYFLDASHKVLVKDMDVQYLIGAFDIANRARKHKVK